MASEQEWTPRQRLEWRIRFAAGVLAIATALISGLGYLWTRASVSDLALKADKTEIARLDSRLDGLGTLTNNVRDNLLVLMAKQKAEPVSLPLVGPLAQPLAPAVRP